MTPPLWQILAPLTPAQREAVLDGPALQPPKGVKSNFNDPENQNAMSYFVVSLCLFISTVVVVLRIYAKTLYVRKARFEDFFAIAAFGLFVTWIVCCYQMIGFDGFFVHFWDIRIRDLSEILYIVHIGATVYAVCMMCLKVAILLDWINIFVPKGTRNAFFWMCHAVMWVNILFYCSVTIAGCLSCIPYKSIWNKTIPSDKCINQKAMDVSSAAINLTSDMVVLLLPQRTIWNLQMGTKKKIGISVVFATGVLACVSAGFRLGSTVRYYVSQDMTYEICKVILWATAEMTCGFLVLCIPATPSLFNDSSIISHFISSLRVSMGSSKSYFQRSSKKSQSSGSRPDPDIYHNMERNAFVYPVKLDSRDGSSRDKLEKDDIALTNSPYVRTEPFVTSETRGHGGMPNNGYNHQHPWSKLSDGRDYR